MHMQWFECYAMKKSKLATVFSMYVLLRNNNIFLSYDRLPGYVYFSNCPIIPYECNFSPLFTFIGFMDNLKEGGRESEMVLYSW